MDEPGGLPGRPPLRGGYRLILYHCRGSGLAATFSPALVEEMADIIRWQMRRLGYRPRR